MLKDTNNMEKDVKITNNNDDKSNNDDKPIENIKRNRDVLNIISKTLNENKNLNKTVKASDNKSNSIYS